MPTVRLPGSADDAAGHGRGDDRVTARAGADLSGHDESVAERPPLDGRRAELERPLLLLEEGDALALRLGRLRGFGGSLVRVDLDRPELVHVTHGP